MDLKDQLENHHSTWNYVYFIIYLNISNPNDFNGMENLVWEKLMKNDNTLIPNYTYEQLTESV